MCVGLGLTLACLTDASSQWVRMESISSLEVNPDPVDALLACRLAFFDGVLLAIDACEQLMEGVCKFLYALV
jgi:hypothetical protein